MKQLNGMPQRNFPISQLPSQPLHLQLVIWFETELVFWKVVAQTCKQRVILHVQ